MTTSRPESTRSDTTTTRPRDGIDANTTTSGSTARPRTPPRFSAKTLTRKPAGTVISPASAAPTPSQTATAQSRHLVMPGTVALNPRGGNVRIALAGDETGALTTAGRRPGGPLKCLDAGRGLD